MSRLSGDEPRVSGACAFDSGGGVREQRIWARTDQSRLGVPAFGAWLATRALGVCLLTGVLPYSPGFARVNGDVQLYATWSRLLLHGAVPYHDFKLMYPPGVVPLLAVPHGSTNMYVAEYIGLALLADLLCLWLLSRRGQLGAWLWIIAVPLLGPVSWGRLDIFVALALIAGLAALEEERPILAGACIAYAGLIKLWPLGLLVLLLPLVRSGQRLRFVGAGSGMLGVFLVPLFALGGGPGLWSSVTFESSRGVELESLPAVPLHVAQVLGASWHTDVRFGSLDISVAHAGLIRLISEVVLIVGWLAIAVWVLRLGARRINPASCLLLVVCLTIATNRVLSPQYLLWLAAAAALCIDSTPDPRRLGIWVCAAAASTQLLFPFAFAALAAGTSVGLMAATVHAILILAAGVIALAETRRSLTAATQSVTPGTSATRSHPVATATA